MRFVSIRSGDEVVAYDSWSFEEWGRFRTGSVAGERVREVTADRLGTDAFASGVGRPPGDADVENLVVRFENVTQRDRDGEVRRTPAVPFAKLAEAAPRVAHVTVDLEGDAYSRTVPVFVDSVTISLD